MVIIMLPSVITGKVVSGIKFEVHSIYMIKFKVQLEDKGNFCALLFWMVFKLISKIKISSIKRGHDSYKRICPYNVHA